ncbi:MAG: pseudouridine synthase [Myxococcota bacterium]|jgi:pseudouridine synthase
MKEKGKIRLHKFLADCGIASRRRSEQLIAQGKVSVNGTVASEMGMIIDPLTDAVMVDGKPVNVTVEKQYILMNKPRGVITTTVDPEKRATVIDVLGAPDVRVYPVGRLDIGTEGVLLLTNDGELANALVYPLSELWKIYEVKVQGVPTPQSLLKLKQGLTEDAGPTAAPARVKVTESSGKSTWLIIQLTGGRYHQVKSMCAEIGHTVLKLRRIEFAGLTCDGMAPGEWRYLKPKEVGKLWALARTAKAAADARKRRGDTGPAKPPKGKKVHKKPVGVEREGHRARDEKNRAGIRAK